MNQEQRDNDIRECRRRRRCQTAHLWLRLHLSAPPSTQKRACLISEAQKSTRIRYLRVQQEKHAAGRLCRVTIPPVSCSFPQISWNKAGIRWWIQATSSLSAASVSPCCHAGRRGASHVITFAAVNEKTASKCIDTFCCR